MEKEESKEQKVVIATEEQRQKFLFNCAMICVESNGREFEPKIDNLSLLVNMVGEDFLKKHYKKRYSEVKSKIDRLKKYIANLVSYYSDIEKQILDKEDISSKRFLKYQEGLSYVFEHLFFIDELFVLLVNQTDLRRMTIPSHYFTALAQKIKKMPVYEAPEGVYSVGEIEERKEAIVEEEESEES